MTVNDPRPELAAMLAPAAAALAEAYVDDMSAAPSPEDHRADADRMPEPETGHDGSEDEFHHAGEAWKGSIAAPGFREWPGDLERRFGLIPTREGDEGRPIECHVGGRMFAGPPDMREFKAWRERQRRREEREKQEAAACAHDIA